MVVAILALGVALAGSAVATTVLNKKKVVRIAKKQANKQITKRAPELHVGDAAALGGNPPSAFATSASEPYRAINSPGQPPFKNGWTNVGSGFSTAAFYRDSIGVVHLKGNLSNATSATVAFTLPVGYRPSQNLFMPAAGGPAAGAANLVIETDGDAIPTCAAAGPCIAGIDGLTFRTP
jgi:hypothetical protein